MVSRKVWFGTEEYMTWVPAPSTGLVRGTNRWVSTSRLLNGGAYGRVSSAGARGYSAAWAPTRRSELSDLKAFLDGVHGNGPLYFVDPFAMKTNVLPQWLASCRMATDDAPGFIWGFRPTEMNTGSSSWGYPSRSARYNLSATYAPSTGDIVRRNYVTDPRTVTGTGWTSQFGTGGSGTTSLVTGAVDGPNTGSPTGTLTTYRRTNIGVAASGGNVGVFNLITGIGGGIGTSVAGGMYVRSSVTANATFRVQVQLNTTVITSTVVNVTLTAGQWTRLSGVVSPTGTFDRAYIWLLSSTAGTFPAGTNIDVAAGQLDLASTVDNYFDGSTTDGVDMLYSWTGSVNNSISTAVSTSWRRSFKFPVPEGYKFVFGAHGSSTGTAVVTLNGVPVTLLSTNTNQLTNTAVATPWAEISVSGSGTLILNALVGRVVPVDAATIQTGRFEPGEGTTGLQITGNPSITGYSAPLDSEGISADFVEVEAWA